ncbi:MAG: hypothetical protein NTY47_09080, partial [Candidatus Omnitrophica bacterium]|nr:hypothetical protein [Candidatus Omnitrophota bacterium]
MSEFVILGGTAVKLVGYYSTQSYLYTKNKGGVFSSDSDAEYGNGFASFNITGNCDTVWAGNGFQKNVSASAAPGSENTITVANTGNVSGGQGLLVWSTNYKVTNNGTISGATKNKLYYSAAYPGINNTANIGVLFLGNADDAGGSNQLINAGTISSPGIAIEADAGDTVITNTGTISGGTYSILTYGGADHVDLNSGDVTGSIDLGTGAAVDQLDLGVTGNLKLHFALDRDTRTSAQVFNAENVTFTNNRVTLAVTQAEDSKNIHNNDSFLIVDANTALTADITKIAVEADSTLPMITFSLSKIANKLYIDSVRDTVYYQDNSGNASLGQALDTLASSSTNDMAFILGALDDTGNATNAQKLEPVAAAPVVNAAIETLNNFGNVFSLQMARLNNDGP